MCLIVTHISSVRLIVAHTASFRLISAHQEDMFTRRNEKQLVEFHVCFCSFRLILIDRRTLTAMWGTHVVRSIRRLKQGGGGGDTGTAWWRYPENCVWTRIH